VALAPPSPDVLDFVAHVAQAYEKLIASPHADPESGLGGRLFYAGELDGAGRALVVAANIAGAATLVASADRVAQKQAIRDGVADFLVTSLDEALRILKNQLRKRETISVCVAIEPAVIVREMNQRGVLPDLLRHDVFLAPRHQSLVYQEGEVDETDLTSIPALVIWRVDSARHQDLAVLDEIALACLDADEWAARRWLRIAPRYLGRMAQATRSLACSQKVASSFIEQIRKQVARGEISVPVKICWRDPRGHEEKHSFEPGKS
jgi:urocanate hydratase